MKFNNALQILFFLMCVDRIYCIFLQGLHSASVPGILAMDVCLKDTSKIVTGTTKEVDAVNEFVTSLSCYFQILFALF